MSYEETIEYLYSRLPVFQRVGDAAYKPGLNNALALDRRLGYPCRAFKSIHIAGTNGKGSVAHMLAAILQAWGLRTGLYTSPHLRDFRERIRVNGQCIPRQAVSVFVERHRNLIEELRPSFFEITSAMAFNHFAVSGVDMAVVEVGMGGRLDSTNIIMPRVSVITNIGLDHTRFLGDTLEKIAAEKAGIIKQDVPVVIGETRPGITGVFTRAAGQRNSDMLFAGRIYSVGSGMMTPEGKQLLQLDKQGKSFMVGLETDLPGVYQRKNIVTVLGVLEVLARTGMVVTEANIRGGLSRVRDLTGLRGRWEVIGHNPLTICDVAHNADGLRQVALQIGQTAFRKIHLVIGMNDDKEPAGLLKLLPGDAAFYFTQAGIPRAMDRQALARAAAGLGLRGSTHPSPVEALNAARERAGKDDLIFITGSTFVVAEVL